VQDIFSLGRISQTGRSLVDMRNCLSLHNHTGIIWMLFSCRPPSPSARQHPSYGDCLEVKSEYYQNCSVLGCVTQCSRSAAHLYEQFLQVQQIGFVTLGPLRCA